MKNLLLILPLLIAVSCSDVSEQVVPFKEQWLTCEFEGQAKPLKWKLTEDAIIAVADPSENGTAKLLKEDDMGFKYFKNIQVIENELAKGELITMLKYHPIYKDMQVTITATQLDALNPEVESLTASGSCIVAN